MRETVVNLVRLGPLPDSEVASTEEVDAFQWAIEAIASPLSIEEARALAHSFGPDSCYGLAWAIVHLVESAPGWNELDVPAGMNEWHELLRTRLANARRRTSVQRGSLDG